jgi:hypothetical protein
MQVQAKMFLSGNASPVSSFQTSVPQQNKVLNKNRPVGIFERKGSG